MMEIDFLIQWKNKVPDKTDLASKIKEMLTQLFRNVESNEFYFNSDDNISDKVDYKISEKNEKVYLKISCDYSEAKSAKLLSSIRDIIRNGKHRKDFLIICTYDEASLSYCCRLMKPFGMFERHLRELMYLITVKAFGADWVDKTFPKKMIADIKKKGHDIKEKDHGINNQDLTETVFELLDYSEISSYLFDERYLEYTAEQVLENKLSDKSLETLSKDEIISIISNSRKDTLWNKLFSKNQRINNLTEDTINAIRIYRNDIMHHHTISEEKFKIMQKDIGKFNQIIKLAINEIEGKIYTCDDYKTVFSLSDNIITGIVSTLNRIFDITTVIGENIRNLSENIISPNVAKAMKNIMQMMMLPSETSDCSNSFDSSTNQHDFQEHQHDIENHSESSS